MKANLEMKGLEQLRRTARKLSDDLWQEGKQAILDEAQPLENRMRMLAPRDEGNLADAIDTRVWKTKRGVIGVVVGITHVSAQRHPEFKGTIKNPSGKRNDYYYPGSQEYGWTARGKHYPGQPYIRPAWDERRLQMRINIKNILKGIIERVRAK